ncbi:hypothetical protein PIB30_086814 [Stylosanthes scabra]|uniref:GRF-type domain-containing protein n=1 Tax=Stylosanthes scabra TaxID=79078 RepID=A0ABU6ZRU7_9FABA|nr:hypothetical protein [Stylosanthes scabra]
MSRRSRSNTSASNGSYNGSEASSSMKKHENNLPDRCFRGEIVSLLKSGTSSNPGRWFIRCPMWKTGDCKYFAWVDKIDGGWEGLAQTLILIANEKPCSLPYLENNESAQLEGFRETDTKILMKMWKIREEIRCVRMLVVVNFLFLFAYVSFNLFHVLKH